MTGVFYSTHEEELSALGEQFAASLTGGVVVLLSGDLGAGKTTFTKGIARFFGIDHAPSPTFTLMNVYPIDANGAQEFVHIDTYRLETPSELLGVGMQDYIGQKHTITVIEWPEKAAPLVADMQTISVQIDSSQNGRTIHIS